MEEKLEEKRGALGRQKQENPNYKVKLSHAVTEASPGYTSDPG